MNFDEYYEEVVRILKEKNKCAPYKMAWLEFYERGLTPMQATEDEFAPTEDIDN